MVLVDLTNHLYDLYISGVANYQICSPISTNEISYNPASYNTLKKMWSVSSFQANYCKDSIFLSVFVNFQEKKYPLLE
jgi:hypothetical protein